MKLMRYLLFSMLLIVLSASTCEKDNNKPMIEVTGVLQQQGVTTYQYGTHVMPGYALRSSTIDLDQYVGQNVTVRGYLIESYPVENGPEYLEVEEVVQ